MRSQTRKTIKFLTLEQNLIKFKLSFSSLSSVFHQVSHFRFPSFISLIRLEIWLRIFRKNSAKFSKIFTHSPPQLYSEKFKSSTTLTTSFSQKNYKSLPTTRKKFERFYKISTRTPKKGHAGIVTGGQVPLRKNTGISTTTCVDWLICCWSWVQLPSSRHFLTIDNQKYPV